MDNSCMFPEGKLNEHENSYTDWLRDPDCRASAFERRPKLDTLGEAYVDSVPAAHRKPHRWGWKTPKTMYHLRGLVTLYPELIFVHVLRNPLDLVADYEQHLHNRVSEFKDIVGYGSFTNATDRYEMRCKTALACARRLHEKSGAAGDGKQQADNIHCNMSLPALVSCANNDGGCSSGHKGQHEVKPASLRCLEMQLWSEMNGAVSTFGRNCLRIKGRYLVWHGEDDYALRGINEQADLQQNIATVFGVPFERVRSSFPEPSTVHGRRLTFGKWKDAKMDNEFNVFCAEVAQQGTMGFFGYNGMLELAARASLDAFHMLATNLTATAEPFKPI